MRTLTAKLLPNPNLSDLILFPAFCLAGWVLIVTAINYVSAGFFLVAGVAVATVAQWSLLRRATGQAVPLPGILVIATNTIGVCGYVWYPSIADRAAVSAPVPDTPGLYQQSAVIFATASVAIFAGGMLAWSRRPVVSESASLTLKERAQAAIIALYSTSTGRMLALAATPLALCMIAYTPSGLWYRSHYAQHVGPLWAVKASGITATAGIALAALLAAQRASSTSSRRMARLLLVAYALTMWSMGSRSLAVIPGMLLLMGHVDPHPNVSRVRRIATSAGLATACLVALQIPLALRNQPFGAGLRPYWHVLMHDPGSMVSLNNLIATLGNILFAVPLSSMTASMGDIPIGHLVTSINPLPGSYTNWEVIKYDLTINRFTPTSGIGELANYGMRYLIAFFAAMGWTLARVQAWNARLPPIQATLTSIAGFGIAGGLSLSLLQYTLRGGLRGFWYFLALSIVLHLVPRLRKGETDS